MKAASLKISAAVLASTYLIGCTNDSVSPIDPSTVIMPGILDLNILEGAEKPDECNAGFLFDTLEEDTGEDFDCVAVYDGQQVLDKLAYQYRDEVLARGWKLVSPKGDEFTFQKTLSDYCKYEILILSLDYIDGRPMTLDEIAQVPPPEDKYDILMFVKTEIGACRNE